MKGVRTVGRVGEVAILIVEPMNAPPYSPSIKPRVNGPDTS